LPAGGAGRLVPPASPLPDQLGIRGRGARPPRRESSRRRGGGCGPGRGGLRSPEAPPPAPPVSIALRRVVGRKPEPKFRYRSSARGREHHARLRRDEFRWTVGGNGSGCAGRSLLTAAASARRIRKGRRGGRGPREASARAGNPPARTPAAIGTGGPACSRTGSARRRSRATATALDLPQAAATSVSAELGTEGRQEGEAAARGRGQSSESWRTPWCAGRPARSRPVHRVHRLEGEVVEQRQAVADGRERTL